VVEKTQSVSHDVRPELRTISKLVIRPMAIRKHAKEGHGLQRRNWRGQHNANASQLSRPVYPSVCVTMPFCNLLAGLLEPARHKSSLPGHQLTHARIVHGRVHVALHQRSSVVVLDVPNPSETNQEDGGQSVNQSIS